MRKCLLVLIIMCLGLISNGQNVKYNTSDFAKHPLWIQMMADTNANFFQVQKAYNAYWAHHLKPAQEEDVMNEHRANDKMPGKRKQRKIEGENLMRMQVKKYDIWKMQTEPYVQSDGRIMTPTERLKIWQSQKSNHN